MNVLGAPGAGKSTLGRALAARIGAPYFDSDHYYHVPTDPPFQVQRPPSERLRLLLADLGGHDAWVIGGSVVSFGTTSALDFTHVVFLSLPLDVRLERLRQRERALYGTRLEPGGDMHAAHHEFMEWTAHYDDGTAAGNNRALHEAWLETQRCPVLRVDATLGTDTQLAIILGARAASRRGD